LPSIKDQCQGIGVTGLLERNSGMAIPEWRANLSLRLTLV